MQVTDCSWRAVKTCVCCSWMAGIEGFVGLGVGIHRRHFCLSLVSVVFCRVEVSRSDLSFVQRSPTECGVSNNREREAP